MRIAVFGGSFNPPHSGHVEAAKTAARELHADKLIIIPAARPPHKEQETGSPYAFERLELARLAFGGLSDTELSDIEISRGGVSYTVETLEELKKLHPDDELVLLMGTDMLISFENWKDFMRIFELSSLAAFPRKHDEIPDIRRFRELYSEKYGASVYEIGLVPTEVTSTELRSMLKNREGNNLLPDAVYREIIKKRYYGAKPNFAWLRENSFIYLDEKRVPHVKGCEQEAVRLAEKWGADKDLAAEAGILHDITKKLNGSEQLILCEEYGIITDVDEKQNSKLLHAKTGAAFARDKFGINDEVYSAILWHTTGRADMTLLEKIIYIADYIEPTRDFEGVDELRSLAYEDLDSAVLKGLQMSLEELEHKNSLPHANSIKALSWFREHRK
ncbi:MAG: nicotinate (nicotinamide) nucleotide adenylyltransferase [Firmicutes bacterium HGW-Firmicutes-16]|nr:MAG: nicotinate (nicotinamide) nucleotide adenylyltransferase [Firmicutes bacterium HGW-Firmicutes-16]